MNMNQNYKWDMSQGNTNIY